VDGFVVTEPKLVDNPLGAVVAAPYSSSCPKGPPEARDGGDNLKSDPTRTRRLHQAGEWPDGAEAIASNPLR
jgi:hypothetical protein